jgi:hypothetical protein
MSMKSSFALTALGFVLLSAHCTASAHIYRCTSKDGHKEYSDKAIAPKQGQDSPTCVSMDLPDSDIPDFDPMSAALQRKLPKISLSAGKQILERNLIDPESVRYRNVRLNQAKNAVCGEFNSKNRMGGYSGFSRFVVAGDGRVVSSDVVSGSYLFALCKAR